MGYLPSADVRHRTLMIPKPELFACPTCSAQYKLVRAEADGGSASGQLECRSLRWPPQRPRGSVCPQVFPCRSTENPGQSRTGQAIKGAVTRSSFQDGLVSALRPPPPAEKGRPLQHVRQLGDVGGGCAGASSLICRCISLFPSLFRLWRWDGIERFVRWGAARLGGLSCMG